MFVAKHYPAWQQLVPEIYVEKLQPAVEFLAVLGFEVSRLEEGFAELKWGENLFFLEEMVPEDGYKPLKPGDGYHGLTCNIRVLVDNVDEYYAAATRVPGCKVIRPLSNRYYGLRDFTISGPGNIGLRFATPLRSDVT